MNEKYKNLLKKFGIAGFLFFLIKGILWLIFGTAIYKWLKSLIVLGLSLVIPYFSISQDVSIMEDQKRLLTQSVKYPQLNHIFYLDKITKPFFCKLENKLLVNFKTPLAFRLGSLEYSNQLEYASILKRSEFLGR
jgi:hypothetical protein